MNWSELAAWALWAVTVTLTLVLYVRVSIHDWGMVGLTTVLMGATILLSRSLLAWYGHDVWHGEMLVIWRGLVLIGSPVAIAGYVAGLLRDPPPRRQVIGRLALLGLVVGATMIVVRTP